MPNLQINHIYNYKQIHAAFGVANSGGMRPHHHKLVLICYLNSPVYPDVQGENGILYYCGMGKHGDQDVNYRYNKILNYSSLKGLGVTKTNGFKVYLFYSPRSNTYVYAGEVILAARPRYRNDKKNHRKVIIFPLKSVTSNLKISKRTYKSSHKYADYNRLYDMPIDKLKKQEMYREETSKDLVNHKETSVTHNSYRNRKVRVLAKRYAHFTCQLCGYKSKYRNKATNKPYIQAHHIRPLHNSGYDTLWNVVALCPNCHSEMHHAKDGPLLRHDINIIKTKATNIAYKHGMDKNIIEKKRKQYFV